MYTSDKILDSIPKLITIITSLLIFLGIISSVVYYRSFSINILENITIGESLILFISNFSSFAIATIFGVLISFLFIQKHREPKPKVKDNSKHISQKLELKLWQKLYSVFIVLPIFMLSFEGFSPFVFWTLPVSLLTRIYVLYYILKRLRLIFEYRNLDKKIVDYIGIAGISIILVVSIAMTKAYLSYNCGIGKKITLYSKDNQAIKSDINTVYLGKSNLFYYLYNKTNKKAILIQSDQIYRVDLE